IERSSAGWRQACQLKHARSNKRNCCATTPAATRAISNTMKNAGLGRANRRIRAARSQKVANEYHACLNLNLNAAACLANAAIGEMPDVMVGYFCFSKR